jgi:predicted RNase H-like HicB family nuclease
MLTKYLHAAMSRARYDILPEEGYYGEIPGFQGVWASAESLEECRNELQEVLEGWLLLGLRMGHKLPVIDNIDLTAEFEAA